MAQLFDIRKVTVGPRNLEAVVELAPTAPLMTSEDLAGTELVYNLMPELADHVCLGDSAPRFGDVIGDTELAHLLEHVTVELLARTDAAGDVSSGQTVELAERTYQITLACPDDVLVAGALSSAVWILQWAYSGGGEPEPDVEAIASGLVGLVQSLDTPSDGEKDQEPAQQDVDPQPEPEEAYASGYASESGYGQDYGQPAGPEDEPAAQDPFPAVESADDDPEPAQDPEPASEPAQPRTPAAWDMDDVPRPRFVR